LADDGGGEITFNDCKSWSSLNNQPTAQFYRVNVDNRFPYWVYGGQQDNTSMMIQSRNNSFGITEKDWEVGPVVKVHGSLLIQTIQHSFMAVATRAILKYWMQEQKR
jgi:hypothetical protein